MMVAFVRTITVFERESLFKTRESTALLLFKLQENKICFNVSHIFLRFTKSNRNRSIGTCRALQQNIDVYRATRILIELISTDGHIRSDVTLGSVFAN